MFPAPAVTLESSGNSKRCSIRKCSAALFRCSDLKKILERLGWQASNLDGTRNQNWDSPNKKLGWLLSQRQAKQATHISADLRPPLLGFALLRLS